MTDVTLPLAGFNAAPAETARKRIRTAYFAALLVFAFGFAVAYGMLSTHPGFIGTDDYYHSRIAAQLIEQGRLRVDFPWLPYTILSPEQFVDHHLLYHMYLAPWMHWGGITGVKIAQSLILGAITLAFWSLLRFLDVRFATIWTIALFALSTPFLYRMLMIRTQAAALLLLLLMLHSLFRGRYRWLIGLAFAFTWLYNGFILMPVIVVLYALSAWITERRVLWQPVVYVLIGVALGLIINPYFPQNIAFIIDHLREKTDIATSIRVGSEWYPYTTGDLLENSSGALIALGAGILASSFRRIGRDQIETTLLLIALVTLYMLFRSRRFIEYFPAFALLFCAAAWGRPNSSWQAFIPGVLLRQRAAFVYRIVFLIPVLLLAAGVLQNVYKDVQGAKSLDYMAGASAWLQQHTDPGELIFQTDWDDFTRLFYHNTENVYLVGLDPTYLQVAAPVMWTQWAAITQGQVARPSVLIRETFGARFVVSDTNHSAFAKQAETDPTMQLVYRDDNSLIWQIGDAE